MGEIFRRIQLRQDNQPRWLANGYIPMAGVTSVEGDPGNYKTTVIVDVCASVSTGRKMLGSQNPLPPGNVVVCNSEDNENAIYDRLVTAGAELSRIFVPPQGLRLPNDMQRLYAACRQHTCKLFVLDPLASFVDRPLTADSAMRSILDALNGLATELNMAVVIVRHWPKSRNSSTVYRAAGSQSITAAVRSQLIVAADPSSPEYRILAQTKNNLGPIAPSLRFATVTSGAAAKIEWLGPTEISVDALMNTSSDRDRTAREEAKRFLFSVLADGPLFARDVFQAAKKAGISDRTLRRAKEELGVASIRRGFGRRSVFSWTLSVGS